MALGWPEVLVVVREGQMFTEEVTELVQDLPLRPPVSLAVALHSLACLLSPA